MKLSKSVAIRLDDEVYRKFNEIALEEHRSLSNLIETFALKKLGTCGKRSYTYKW